MLMMMGAKKKKLLRNADNRAFGLFRNVQQDFSVFCSAARDAACFAAFERHLADTFASAAPKTPIEHHRR